MMNNKSLSALVDQVRGVSYKPKDIHDTLNDLSIALLRANNIFDGSIEFSDVIYVDRKRVSSSQILRRGDILVCASSGSKDLVGKAASFNCDGEYTFGAFCKVVRPKNIDDADYISVFFQSPKYRREIAASALGANINNIRNEHIDNLVINWPVKLKRDIIVSLLNQSKSIITLRKKQLHLFDELIKARFVEMFGDPDINPLGWPKYTFEEISDLITDGEHATPKRFNQGIYLLSARNVLNHALSFDKIDYIDQVEYDRISKRIIPQEGDVLISCSGTIGRTCTVPEGLKFQFVRSVALIRFKKTINPIFMEHQITMPFIQKQIDSSKSQSSQANLFQGKIRKLLAVVPPKELQEQFLSFVKQIDKSKVAVQKSLEQTQMLFDSLMQQYFG